MALRRGRALAAQLLALAHGTLFLAAAGAAGNGASEAGSARLKDLTDRPFHVLLTGFGPFGEFRHNPTSAIARRLSSMCDDVDIMPRPGDQSSGAAAARVRVCWRSEVLPVNRTGAVWTTQHLQDFAQRQEALPYDAVIHTGLEDFAKGLKLEIAGANVQAESGGQPAVWSGPDLLATTVNLGWLSVKRLATVSAPRQVSSSDAIEMWSRDAGTFYCNEVYYRTLEYIRSNLIASRTGALLPALFVHVQEASATPVQADIDSIRQIAAHALWATYVGPGAAAGDRADALAATGGAGELTAAAGLAASFALGGALAALGAVAVARRVCPARGLRAPLWPSSVTAA